MTSERQMGAALEPMVLALCHKVNRCDDRLGQYSDYEGCEEGSTYRMWQDGYKSFRAQCDEAIDAHLKAIEVWKSFKKLNETRA